MLDARRRRELAKLHCLKRDLGLDDAAYRAVLHSVGGVESSKLLDERGMAAVLDHLARLARERGLEGRPHNMSSDDAPAELRKVEALLAEAGRAWAYADGIAKRMYGVPRVAWLKSEQLRGVLTALVKDAARHGRRTR